MKADNSFSISSVFIGYFMVAGGIALGLLAMTKIDLGLGSAAGYVAVGAGAFVGGFFAARASRGQTIIEPAIGAVAVIGTLVAIIMATPLGDLLRAFAAEQSLRAVLISGGAALVGAVAGAFVSEKALGEATSSGIPWLLYTAFTALGASVVAYAVAIGFVFHDAFAGRGGSDTGTTALVVGLGLGCLLTGLVAGAAARVRILVPSFVGAGGGTLGFLVLAGGQRTTEGDALVGLIVFAVGGGLVALLGAALGWSAFGRKA
ncbi:MAG: hypothetical protein R2939_16295 [Kofleriaceae bacterium]